MRSSIVLTAAFAGAALAQTTVPMQPVRQILDGQIQQATDASSVDLVPSPPVAWWTPWSAASDVASPVATSYLREVSPNVASPVPSSLAGVNPASGLQSVSSSTSNDNPFTIYTSMTNSLGVVTGMPPVYTNQPSVVTAQPPQPTVSVSSYTRATTLVSAGSSAASGISSLASLTTTTGSVRPFTLTSPTTSSSSTTSSSLRVPTSGATANGVAGGLGLAVVGSLFAAFF